MGPGCSLGRTTGGRRKRSPVQILKRERHGVSLRAHGLRRPSRQIICETHNALRPFRFSIAHQATRGVLRFILETAKVRTKCLRYESVRERDRCAARAAAVAGRFLRGCFCASRTESSQR